MSKNSKYYNSPKELAYRKAYKQRPEVKKRHRIEQRKRSRRPEIKALSRRNHLKRLYGISPEQYDMLIKAQHGVCAVCFTPTKGKLFVDHDHTTNKVRGLLCQNCNFILGLCDDSTLILHEAINYLTRYREVA